MTIQWWFIKKENLLLLSWNQSILSSKEFDIMSKTDYTSKSCEEFCNHMTDELIMSLNIMFLLLEYCSPPFYCWSYNFLTCAIRFMPRAFFARGLLKANTIIPAVKINIICYIWHYDSTWSIVLQLFNFKIHCWSTGRVWTS